MTASLAAWQHARLRAVERVHPDARGVGKHVCSNLAAVRGYGHTVGREEVVGKRHAELDGFAARRQRHWRRSEPPHRSGGEQCERSDRDNRQLDARTWNHTWWRVGFVAALRKRLGNLDPGVG